MSEMKPLQVRMPHELKRTIEQAAKDNGRSTSNYVRYVLSEKLKADGYDIDLTKDSHFLSCS